MMIAAYSRLEHGVGFRVFIQGQRAGGSNGRASGSQDSRFGHYCRLCLSATCCVGLRLEGKMPTQIATASIALLFTAVLTLSSYRFIDSRPSVLNPAISAQGMR